MKTAIPTALALVLLPLSLAAQSGVRTSAEAAYQSMLSGDHESAIIAYEAMLSTEPDQADFHFNLGIAYFHSFRFQSALRAFDRAVQLSIENPDFQALAEFNIGVTLFEQGKLYQSNDPVRVLDYLDQAIDAFENTVELDPSNEAGILNLSRCKELRALLQSQQDAETPISDSNQPDAPQPESDPSAEAEEREAGEGSTPDSSPTDSDASDAPRRENPRTSEELPGNPSTARLDMNEALLLLDALEHAEKRITLSELDPADGASETSGSEANW